MDPRTRQLLEPKKTGKQNAGKGSQVSDPQIIPAKHPNHSPRQSQSTTVSGHPRPPSAYDAKSLLNPRASRVAQQLPSRTSRMAEINTESADSKGASPSTRGDKPGFSMLEGVYGTELRSQRPTRKRQMDGADGDEEGDDTQKKPKPSVGPRGDAGVGDYFKSGPHDPHPRATAGDVVDLTNDDGVESKGSDDEVQITSVRNKTDDQEVCFGMLPVTILAEMVPKPKKDASQFKNLSWPKIDCRLKRNKERGVTIECSDIHGCKFGNIEEGTARILAPCLDVFDIRTQTRILPRPKKSGQWEHQPCSERLHALINLYGRRIHAERMAHFLGQNNVWLRNPIMPDRGIRIENPHANKPSMPGNLKDRSSANTSRTVEETTEAVSKLFDFQASTAASLLETEGPSEIITPLLSHQKQALTFMLQHENDRTFSPEEEGNSSLWRKKHNDNGSMVYEEVVTGLELKTEPDQVYGGLLADVMGLGKTLEALSLIVSTLNDARAFGATDLRRTGPEAAEILLHSRATLIVAPVSTVKNWEDQIAEHVLPGALRYHVYHGPHREHNVWELAKYDVIISTYSTIASEINSKKALGISPMRRIFFFRIMLDEAHTIRESKSSQSQAMYGLSAQRRWCLTGTPIQNRMEDLGSLTQFLRLYPYNTTAGFNQYIRSPAQAGQEGFLKSIRVFVDSFTLRRLKDRIELPERHDLIVKLTFSPAERRLHDFFKEQFSVTMEKYLDSKKKEHRSGDYHRILQGIMVLRLICAHGKELLKGKQLRDLRGISKEEAIDLESNERPATIEARQAYECLGMMAEANLDLCKNCGKQISGSSPNSPQTESDEGSDEARAYVLPCLDLLCDGCFAPHKDYFDTATGDADTVYCPFCALTMMPKYIPITRSTAEVLEGAPVDDMTGDDTGPEGDQYGGPHTKTRALLEDLKEMQDESTGLIEQGEAPLKCVIFSEFTSHLDLIERGLTDNGLTFVRIDGSLSLAKRRKVLDSLNSDNSVTILLASIKAAGQGLNLTAASRAFIMEPMWNPAAEAQAVDRIYRIGQKRRVTIKRYHMIDSFEDKIVALQQKKQKMADMSMNRAAMADLLGTKNKKELRAQNMKELLDVFK